MPDSTAGGQLCVEIKTDEYDTFSQSRYQPLPELWGGL